MTTIDYSKHKIKQVIATKTTMAQLNNDENLTGLHAYLIGIQGAPDARVCFNGYQAPVILGPTGVFQLELEEPAYITSIYVESLGQGESMIIDIAEYGGGV